MTKKILLIEDEEDVREVLRIALTSQRSHEIFEATNGEEGLQAMEKHLPDLVICDLKMPRVNGYEFIIRVAKNPGLQHIPIFILTSLTTDSEREDEEWAKSLNVSAFASKPFQPMEIVKKAEELLKRGPLKPDPSDTK